jgi:hypothetical protein
MHVSKVSSSDIWRSLETYPRDELRTISETPCSECGCEVCVFLAHVFDDLEDIIPWCVGLDAIQHPHNLVAERILQALEIVGLAY